MNVNMTDSFESARTLHNAGNFASAAALYEQVIALNPEHFKAHNNLGDCHDELGQLDKAELAFRTALALMPDEAPIVHNLGRNLHKQGKYDEAEQHYRLSIEQEPTQPGAYFNLGRLLQDQGKMEQAATILQDATRLNPNNEAAQSVLGDVLYSLNLLEPALSAYRQVTEIAPHDAFAHFQVGKALETLQRYDEAAESFSRAVEIDIESVPPKEALVRTLSQAGRHDEAITALNIWLKQYPENPLATHMLAALGASNTPDRASDDYVRDTFDRFAQDFDHTLEKLQYQAPQLVHQAVRDSIGEPAGNLQVLDAGCGTGLCGPLLRHFAQSLTGVDLSAGMLKLASAHKVYDELLEVELIDYLSSQHSRFDLIASADTFCYLGKLDSAFKSAFQALRTGGTLIVTLEQLTGSETYQLNTHGRYAHTEIYVRKMLAEAGFHKITIDYDKLRLEAGAPVAGLIVRAWTSV
jgi:predicted TPR repeat methyltransferase